MKDSQHLTLLGNFKLKQWNADTRLIEWLKPKNWWYQMLMQMWSWRALIYCWWECKMMHSFWKTVWQFPTQLRIVLLCNPANSLLGIYPNELNIYVHTETCTQLLIETLFIISQNWKWPRCPLKRWVDKQTVAHPYNRIWFSI